MFRAGVALMLLSGICSLLRLTRWAATAVHDALPYPADAEMMGEGEIRETIVYTLLADIECLISDYLDPAIKLLQGVSSTPPPPRPGGGESSMIEGDRAEEGETE